MSIVIAVVALVDASKATAPKRASEMYFELNAKPDKGPARDHDSMGS